MNDRSSFTQTTAPVTLDVPALAAISAALDDEINRVERRLERSKSERAQTRNRNHLENLRAGVAGLDPLYTLALRGDLYTPEHRALIDAALERGRQVREGVRS